MSLSLSQASVLPETKCFLGHAACVFPAGRMAAGRNPFLVRPKLSLRIRGCCNSLEGTSHGTFKNVLEGSQMPFSSWLSVEDVHDAAYGGWSQGGTNMGIGKKRDMPVLMAVGGGTSVAICLAVLVYFTFTNKGFRSSLCASVAGIHQLYVPLASRLAFSGRTKSSEPSFSAGEEGTSSKLEDKDQREQLETSESEVTCVSERLPGKLLIPAVIDSAQREALSALQKLKIVESNVHTGELCTRREYARWLVSGNSLFSRSPTSKIFPSVFIEDVTVLAFDDIPPNDPDFMYIQGLAEAGVIPSKLSANILNSSVDKRTQSQTCTMFYPENLLSRVDLVVWKIFAEHKNLAEVDRRTLEKQSGFLDIEQIHMDAWPAIFLDALAGDKSVTARAFGYSRRFQPHKPVTKGQVAIVLTSGRVAAMVSELLCRLEAENSAREAVAQEILLEMKSKGEIKSLWEKDLHQAKQKSVDAERILESAVSDLNKEKAQKEISLPSLLKEKSRLNYEHEFLSSLKQEVLELEKSILDEETDVVVEKQQLKHFRTDFEENLEDLLKTRSLAEAEKRALILSRLGAEDQARQIQAQSEIFAEAVKRWKYTKSFTCSCCSQQNDRIRNVAQEEKKLAAAGDDTKSTEIHKA